MTPSFANNASTTLASGISSSTTSIILAAGTGAEFPSPGVGQFFPLTFNDRLTGAVYEVTYCTARTADTLTVIRGQEGTTAMAWLLGDYAYCAWTAELSFWATNRGEQAFPASGTFVVPYGVFQVFARVWGGGGGGGSAVEVASAGSGAGPGGYTEGWFAVTPGQSITVTVGAGGVGSTGSFNGTAGGSSSFGSFCSATGGGGGYYSAGGGQTTVGLPGAGSGGQVNLTGQSGGQGLTPTSTLLFGGFGGAPPFGSLTPVSIGGVGSDGSVPAGAGAGGSYSGVGGEAGGDGGAGLVIISW